jgi:transcriptional regulator with XRE-family HTH domain
MRTFGLFLVWGRKNLRLRQKELASSILKLDGESISITYLSDLEHDRRTPSEPLLLQFATVLQVPLDLLYCSLRKLPPDIKGCSASEEQILAAFQAFRQALVIDPVSIASEDVHPVPYQGAVGKYHL